MTNENNGIIDRNIGHAFFFFFFLVDLFFYLYIFFLSSPWISM